MWQAAGTDTIVSKIWTKNLGQTVVLIYVPLFVALLICISANYSKYLCKKRSVFFVNEKNLGQRVAPTYVPLIVSLIWEAGLAQDRCLLVPSLTTFFIVTQHKRSTSWWPCWSCQWYSWWPNMVTTLLNIKFQPSNAFSPLAWLTSITNSPMFSPWEKNLFWFSKNMAAELKRTAWRTIAEEKIAVCTKWH